MRTFFRGLEFTKYFLQFWLRRTGIWYRFMPPERRLEDLALLAFNKAVCTDFGLTLYEAVHPANTIARRIDVTR